MPDYNPRTRNEKRGSAPKATAQWFDDRREDRRGPKHPCGFKERD